MCVVMLRQTYSLYVFRQTNQDASRLFYFYSIPIPKKQPQKLPTLPILSGFPLAKQYIIVLCCVELHSFCIVVRHCAALCWAACLSLWGRFIVVQCCACFCLLLFALIAKYVSCKNCSNPFFTAKCTKQVKKTVKYHIQIAPISRHI